MYHTQSNTNNGDNEHAQSQQQNAAPQPQKGQSAPAVSKTVVVVGIPSVTVHGSSLIVGGADSSSTRSYTPLKVLGDGSFGTVSLVDWHGPLVGDAPGAPVVSPMQRGPGARAEWVGKRLVAVKRMQKKFEGGWAECEQLKELQSLRRIPFHPSIIPLYDFFILPSTKEFYCVFESMEGNLYHLIKARKGRALAGGLVASIFRQIVEGLYHVHSNGYQHRDMKPENLLVTTTGLFDYQSLSPVAPPNAHPEKDVVAIIKIADFGLAREINSEPPYTQYVSTRWYRAPEVLLCGRDYSTPVDQWALGAILAELVTLRPLFPGSGQMDQMARICEVLGDPSDEYGYDARGSAIGGGEWTRGIGMAKAVGCIFPKMQPQDFSSLFDRSVPRQLVNCINDLLKYDPQARLTSLQCVEHPYLRETAHLNKIPRSNIQAAMSTPSLPSKNQLRNFQPTPSRHIHSQAGKAARSHLPDASATHRTPFYPSPAPSDKTTPVYNPDVRIYDPNAHDHIQGDHRSRGPVWNTDGTPARGWDMDVSPRSVPDQYPHGQLMDVHQSPNPSRPYVEPDIPQGKTSKLSFKKPSKWGLGGMFGGGDKSHNLPSVEEAPIASSSSTPSLKRSQSSSTDSKSLREIPVPLDPKADKKRAQKEADRLDREAEKQRRELAAKTQREQARAVIQKRNKLQSVASQQEIEWKWQHTASLLETNLNGHVAGFSNNESNPKRLGRVNGNGDGSSMQAPSGRFGSTAETSFVYSDWRNESERNPKARRRDNDDDHSMSSFDMHSIGRMSSISFATVDSDPGPGPARRNRNYGPGRMTSSSSLRTSLDEFPGSRSSTSFSQDNPLASDFPPIPYQSGGVSGNMSPPPMQSLSLSPGPPSPPWVPGSNTRSMSPRRHKPPSRIGLPPMASHMGHLGSTSPYHENGHGSLSPGVHPINPIFKVPPIPSSGDPGLLGNLLPPFSHISAVASAGSKDPEYPPLSPMSFCSPDES